MSRAVAGGVGFRRFRRLHHEIERDANRFANALVARGLKPGAKIIIFGAVKKDDGTLEANRVNVGRDGIAPPM